MEELLAMPLVTIGIIVLVVILISIKQINEYQRGVTYTLGKYTKTKTAGWRLIVPVFQQMVKVDIRTKAVDVPDQDAITKDNISIRINAVIYYKIIDAAKSINEVENFYYAISQLAQTTMRNAVGEVTLEELLKNRDEIAKRIMEIVEKTIANWGIDVESVELKDIVIPDDLKRTIAKVAEAERERQAVIIASEGEVMASENMAKAAHTLAMSPGALHLRTLQSINDISSDQSNTTVWMVPIEVLKAVEGIAEKLGKK
jgi:regulator of protease activity HflC (stomatin/prohibitin superfamily)